MAEFRPGGKRFGAQTAQNVATGLAHIPATFQFPGQTQILARQFKLHGREMFASQRTVEKLKETDRFLLPAERVHSRPHSAGMDAIDGHDFIEITDASKLRVEHVQGIIGHFQFIDPGRVWPSDAASKNRRAGGDDIVFQKIGKLDRVRLIGMDIIKIRPVARLEMARRVVKAQRIFLMRIKELNLLLQLRLAGPVIIPLQQGDILSLALFKCREAVSDDPNVLIVQQQAEFIGMSALVFQQDIAGAIGGMVFADHDLVLEIHFLHEDAVQRMAEVALVVVGDHHDAELHRPRLVQIPRIVHIG